MWPCSHGLPKLRLGLKLEVEPVQRREAMASAASSDDGFSPLPASGGGSSGDGTGPWIQDKSTNRFKLASLRTRNADRHCVFLSVQV